MSRHNDDEIFDDDPLASRREHEVHYHYSQNKNGNGGSGANINTVLLACLLAIIGFLGIQLWGINGRLAVVETNVTSLLARP